jgi:conflict system pore-forming effector with SLATT domain
MAEISNLFLLDGRQYHMQVLSRAHAMAADKYERYNLWVGIPVVVLTTIVGSTAFATLANQGKSQTWIAVMLGTLSAVAAVFAAVQTFLNYGTRAQKHSQAAGQLNGLSRRIDVLWRLRQSDKADAEIAAIDSELSQIVANAPRVSIGLQQVAKDALDSEKAMFKPRTLEEMLPTAEPPREEPPAKVSQQYVFSSPGS